MTIQKRSVPQAVFDSPEAISIAREGHRRACADLAKLHPTQLDTGNPNHPINDGLFGYDTETFLAKQRL